MFLSSHDERDICGLGWRMTSPILISSHELVSSVADSKYAAWYQVSSLSLPDVEACLGASPRSRPRQRPSAAETASFSGHRPPWAVARLLRKYRDTVCRSPLLRGVASRVSQGAQARGFALDFHGRRTLAVGLFDLF